jgi:peptidoglycan/LPS O-acetylase OafA/YrhL
MFLGVDSRITYLPLLNDIRIPGTLHGHWPVRRVTSQAMPARFRQIKERIDAKSGRCARPAKRWKVDDASMQKAMKSHSNETGVSPNRRDIDGLRALAVLAVILFHTYPKILPGGFVGVDIFFVISGYLITGIISGGLEKKQFSLFGFYARRIRRIFPALVLVLIVCIPLGWYLLAFDELKSFFKGVFASSLFSANLMLWSETNYFDVAAHAKPLLHLWSLGIEEQFYLVWPAALMITPRRFLIKMICAVLFVSFALNIAFVKDDPTTVFYLPFTRVWELAAGAIALNIDRPEGRAADILAFAGLSLIEISLFAFTDRTPFPGVAALLPTIGTVLLLLCEKGWINTVILANPVGVRVGLISYPLYLWHWPVLVFAADYKLGALTDAEKGLAIGTAFVLAWLTYKVVERPVRFNEQRRVIVPLVLSMAAIATVSIFPALGLVVPTLPADVAELMKVNREDGPRPHECLLFETDNFDFPPSCIDQTRPLIVIWGDSTASALVPGFRELQKKIPFGIAQFTAARCSPTLVPNLRFTERCIHRNQRTVQQIADTKPDLVILQGLWNGTDTTETLRPSVEFLQRAGIRRIVIFGATVNWPIGLPETVAIYYRRTGRLIPERVDAYYQRNTVDYLMGRVAQDLGVQFISTWKPICNPTSCLARIGSSLISRDEVHLTQKGAEFLVKAIAPDLGLVAK